MFEEFEGTKAVADAQKFDAGALADYLKQHVDGFKGDLTVAQFKGGQSNPTFKVTVGSNEGATNYVLRSKPAPKAKLLPSAHAIEREYRVQDALYKTGF